MQSGTTCNLHNKQRSQKTEHCLCKGRMFVFEACCRDRDTTLFPFIFGHSPKQIVYLWSFSISECIEKVEQMIILNI